MTMWRRQFPLGRVYFPRKLVFCCANLGEPEINHGTLALRSVPPTLLATENHPAISKKQGSSNAAAAMRVVTNSDPFICRIVSQLGWLQKYRYVVGREVTSKALPEEHRKGTVVVGAVEKLTNSPSEKTCPESVPPGIKRALSSRQEKAMARVTEIGPTGNLPSNVVYLMEVGMELQQIERAACRYPYFASISVERNLRPLVDYFLHIGVPKREIPAIFIKSPQICSLRLGGNIISTMSFLESLGVDRKKWGKVIYKSPVLLTLSRARINRTVEFLCKMGIPVKSVGKIISDFPSILCYSIESNLQPTADYFESLGFNVKGLLCACPQIFGLSIEHNLKPVTGFFLERGFSMSEVGTMVSKCGNLYCYSLAGNLTQKWEFFLTMNYSRLELLKVPAYFGYSLEQRIKPRYALVKESGVNLPLSRMLTLSVIDFNKALAGKVKKLVGDKKQRSNSSSSIL